jgi:Ca-activated chloride channel family protein
MIGLRYPLALLLMVLPVLFALVQWHNRRQAGLPLPLDIWAGSPMPDASLLLRLVVRGSSLLILAAWLLMSVALAGPYRSLPGSIARSRNADVLFVIDVSPSMAAMDLVPTRIGAAINLVKSFLDRQPDAAVGILAFGAEAALICPPTPDHALVRERLDLLKPGLYGNGTALGVAMANAFSLLVSSDGRQKVLVIISDGEDNIGRVHPKDIALQCLQRGVSLLVLGFGTRGQVNMDYTDPHSGERRRGTYESDFNESALVEIARSADGHYFGSSDSDQILKMESWLRQKSGLSDVRQTGLDDSQSMTFEIWLMACSLLALAWLLRNIFLGAVV